MYRAIKKRDMENGWWSILQRDTPDGPWQQVATAFGESRAEQIVKALS